jgi:hypothetical protein
MIKKWVACKKFAPCVKSQPFLALFTQSPFGLLKLAISVPFFTNELEGVNMPARIIISAKMFPSIALAFGALMVIANITSGWIFVAIGGLAQAGYLATKVL